MVLQIYYDLMKARALKDLRENKKTECTQRNKVRVTFKVGRVSSERERRENRGISETKGDRFI